MVQVTTSMAPCHQTVVNIDHALLHIDSYRSQPGHSTILKCMSNFWIFEYAVKDKHSLSVIYLHFLQGSVPSNVFNFVSLQGRDTINSEGNSAKLLSGARICEHVLFRSHGAYCHSLADIATTIYNSTNTMALKSTIFQFRKTK